MSEQDPASFIPLPQNWFHILLSLVGAEQHGYGIMQAVLERTNGSVRIWPATLYGSLKRLIADGLIEESDERPVTELDDARRRYYRLTRLGRMALGVAKQECASIGHHGPAIETSHDFTRTMGFKLEARLGTLRQS